MLDFGILIHIKCIILKDMILNLKLDKQCTLFSIHRVFLTSFYFVGIPWSKSFAICLSAVILNALIETVLAFKLLTLKIRWVWNRCLYVVFASSSHCRFLRCAKCSFKQVFRILIKNAAILWWTWIFTSQKVMGAAVGKSRARAVFITCCWLPGNHKTSMTLSFVMIW